MDQDSSSTSQTTQDPGAPVSDAPVSTDVSTPTVSDAVVSPDPASVADATDAPSDDTDIRLSVVKKISEAQNVLVALSSSPSVDEMAAAIGLSLFLDRLGKRATAIYSGSTPNALEFLKPEKTFESTTDALQDFVIALNKDKADHLRYKLDGDYVKIFITPYKTRIDEDDLGFSYGDFNVDLVLALDVSNGIDLDSALREHGRIMHDAVVINITTGNPGKFGEIGWSDKSASSVSEMIAKMLYDLQGKVKIEKEEATAFLTGIVAATNRFSNGKTTPNTMQIASRLMESGANQQLVSKNITPDVDNEFYSVLDSTPPRQDDDPTKLDIKHGEEQDEANINNNEDTEDATNEPDKALLDDLKAAEASLASAGTEAIPDVSEQPVKLDNESDTSATPSENMPDSDITVPSEIAAQEPESAPIPDQVLPTVASATADIPAITGQNNFEYGVKPEKVIQPPAEMDFTSSGGNSEKYGKMLEDAISGIGNVAPAEAPAEYAPQSTSYVSPDISYPTPVENPASMMAPQVPQNPEINGVPEMNYMPMPGEEVLPPPPTPPIGTDFTASEPSTAVAEPAITEPATIAPESTIATPVGSSPVIEPAAPPVMPTPTPLGSQPSMQDQVYTPQAADPSAFKIPGI